MDAGIRFGLAALLLAAAGPVSAELKGPALAQWRAWKARAAASGSPLELRLPGVGPAKAVRRGDEALAASGNAVVLVAGREAFIASDGGEPIAAYRDGAALEFTPEVRARFEEARRGWTASPAGRGTPARRAQERAVSPSSAGERLDRVRAAAGLGLERLFDGARERGGQDAVLGNSRDAAQAKPRGWVTPPLEERAASQAPPPPGPGVDPAFGAKNGPEIVNKATVLAEIDRTLGVSKPPALEVIFVEPMSMVKFTDGSGSGTNPFGHLAVRYTLPDGTQKVMNVVGNPKRPLVNFLEPVDYFYGTNVFDSGSEQGGLYNREYVSVRLEAVPPEKIVALDRYYRELAERSKKGDAKFDLAVPRLRNLWGGLKAKVLGGDQTEYGNCALWTTKGLEAAGILEATPWPKLALARLLEAERAKDPGNAHVVAYRRVRHAVRTYGKDADVPGFVSPFNWIRTAKYWGIERRADVTVEVPAGSMRAEVRGGGASY